MVVVKAGPPRLDLKLLSAYYVQDCFFNSLPVVVLLGPSTTTNSTLNSSRVQAHIFSIAGFASFSRLTIAPTSPLYLAVHKLPIDQQGDETCRGLAVSLMKYFSDLPGAVKECLQYLVTSGRPGQNIPVFDEQHAATLAAHMTRLDSAETVVSYIVNGMTEKSISWVDLDVVLPVNPVKVADPTGFLARPEEDSILDSQERAPVDYGKHSELVRLFGLPSFIPTSKVRRAPLKPLSSKDSTAITRDAAQKVQCEMQAFIDTEDGYARKIRDLLNSVPPGHLKVDGADVDQGEKILQALFSDCLPQILALGVDLHQRAQAKLEHAMTAANEVEIGADASHMIGRVLAGAKDFASLLLELLPVLRDPYQEYLSASASFTGALSAVLRDSSSHFAQCMRDIGEQRLRSLLIEPVQRLPRYSLYIDNMVAQIPSSHSAVKKLLHAKDIIADICALDGAPKSSHALVERFQECTSRWPDSLVPQGRIVTVVEATEIQAPYKLPPKRSERFQVLLVLFTDCVLVLRRNPGSSLSARGLLAEIDRPSTSPTTIVSLQGSPPMKPLSLSHHFHLNRTIITESHDDRVISITALDESPHRSSQIPPRTQYVVTGRSYLLGGSFEARAPNWSEEIAKARIESRFPEKVRDSRGWSLRSRKPEAGQLGLVCAIFENDSSSPLSLCRESNGRIQVVVDDQSGSRRTSPTDGPLGGAEGTVFVCGLEAGKYRLEMRHHENVFSTDDVSMSDFLPVFLRRLSNLQRAIHQPTSMTNAQAHISHMQKVLEALRPHLQQEDSQKGRFRPASPVKALSSLLSGSSKDATSSKPPRALADLSKPLPPLNPHLERQESLHASEENTNKAKVTIVQSTADFENGSLDGLETTLNAYIIALHSRAGNIVGRALRNRHGADDLKVNELYNTLIEDPGQHRVAAEAPVDVLFAAFEKFLNRAWRERVGLILPDSVIAKLQNVLGNSASSKGPAGLSSVLVDMPPQNQRAFSAIVRLLADLLDAAGNDGDRGTLTASFAEALVESDSHAYIPLLDRLVDDMEGVLDQASPIEIAKATPTSGTIDKAESVNAGSVNSTGSSLRKRFGLGVLTRENSRNDAGESRVGQIWRSLSKKASGDSDSQPRSLSKTFLSRSKSTDGPKRSLSRPNSHDRPQSSHSAQEEGAIPIDAATQAQPKLHSPPPWVGLGEQHPNQAQHPRQALQAQSPARLQKMPPAGAPSKVHGSRKENIPPTLSLPPPTNAPFSSTKENESLQQRRPSLSIPERKSSSPQKLKVQSPQKVRSILSRTRGIANQVSYGSDLKEKSRHSKK